MSPTFVINIDENLVSPSASKRTLSDSKKYSIISLMYVRTYSKLNFNKGLQVNFNIYWDLSNLRVAATLNIKHGSKWLEAV